MSAFTVALYVRIDMKSSEQFERSIKFDFSCDRRLCGPKIVRCGNIVLNFDYFTTNSDKSVLCILMFLVSS